MRQSQIHKRVSPYLTFAMECTGREGVHAFRAKQSTYRAFLFISIRLRRTEEAEDGGCIYLCRPQMKEASSKATEERDAFEIVRCDLNVMQQTDRGME